MQRDVIEFTPDPAHDRRVDARLIECGDVPVALAPHTTLEVIEHPLAVAVPGGARHALGLLEWQDRRIALIDPAVLLGGAEPRSTSPRYALVVALQSAPHAPVEHGAIALDTLPQMLTVTDIDQSTLPASHPCAPFALSCFTHRGGPVPILDTARLFATSSPPPTTPSRQP